MKFCKKVLFRSEIAVLSAFVILIFSITLNGCSGCSPSGIREINAKQNNQDKAAPNLNEDKTSSNKNETRVSKVPEDEILQPKDNKGQSISQASVTVASWNLENFGKSKPDVVIKFIANTLKGSDIIAIQEVVAGYGGSQAVGRLDDELNRKGAKWDYRISNPTSGANSYKRERYAFIWKTSKVTIVGRPWLEIQYSNEINREPFFATFKFNGKLFTLVTFHAITKKMQPETEIKYLKFLPAEYTDKDLLFCGDFNCPESHTVFNPLKKMGYRPIFTGQKTSLKMKSVNKECLASEYDNLFYNASKVKFIDSGVILFYKYFTTLKDARTVSDHIPIWFEFSLN